VRHSILFPLIGVLFLGSICSYAYITKPSSKKESEIRVVSLNLNMTETIFALGRGETIVGRDTLSIYPPQAKKIYNLGGYGQLGVEAILATRPTHVFGTSMVSIERVLKPLERAGVQTAYIPFAKDLPECYAMINQLAATLQVPEKGQWLINSIEKELEPLRKKVAERIAQNKPTFNVVSMFFHGTRSGLIFGKGSSHDGMLQLVGSRAAFDVAGPKPITPEAIFSTQADAVLTNREEWDTIGGVDGLMQIPGIAQIPAGKTKKFIVLPRRLIIGFGPQVALAAQEIYKGLYEHEGPYVVDDFYEKQKPEMVRNQVVVSVKQESILETMMVQAAKTKSQNEKDTVAEWSYERRSQVADAIENSSYPEMMKRGLIEKVNDGTASVQTIKRLGFMPATSAQ